MKVKVGDTIYDSHEQPIMVILGADDKVNISNMAPEATKYCSYTKTEKWTEDEIKKWMEEV